MKQGFTLIELLMVIAILGILFSILLAAFSAAFSGPSFKIHTDLVWTETSYKAHEYLIVVDNWEGVFGVLHNPDCSCQNIQGEVDSNSFKFDN